MKKFVFIFSAMFFIFLVDVDAEAQIYRNMPRIGTEAPSFTAETTNGRINFPADFGRSWKVIFAHPRDFTPVCSSELLEVAYQQDAFDELNAQFIVISADDIETHRDWKKSLEEIPYKDGKTVNINFPLVDDYNKRISYRYGMIPLNEPSGPNIRSVIIIDPDNIVRAVLHYPNEVGRNIDELRRTLVALQTVDNNRNVVTPANWTPGGDVMVTSLSPEERESIGQANSKFYQLSWYMIFKKMDE